MLFYYYKMHLRNKIKALIQSLRKEAINLTNSLNQDSELQTICKNLKNLRRQKEISLLELSLRTDVSVYALKNLEKGVVTPRFSLEELFRLCDYYQIPPDKIFRPL